MKNSNSPVCRSPNNFSLSKFICGIFRCRIVDSSRINRLDEFEIMALFWCLVISLAILNFVVVATSSTIHGDTSDGVETPISDNNDILEEYAFSREIKQPNFSFDKLSEFQELVNQNLILDDTGRDQETLKQVFILHRHGDRTPIQFSARDNLKDEKFWYFHGLGQLTNRGKQRLYVLGQKIRERYNNFMTKSVNKNLRKSRSSGVLRCIESSQVFLASFLGLDSQTIDGEALSWSTREEVGKLWQPASILSVPAKYDGMLAEGSDCKVAQDISDMYDKSEYFKKQISHEYKYEASVLNESISLPTNHFYEWAWAASLLSIEKSYFEHKMKPELLGIYNRVIEAGYKAMVLFQKDQTMKRLRAGLLIKDIVKNMINMRSRPDGNDDSVKRFVHYSAHDINIVMFLGIFNVFEKSHIAPNYAAHVIIELHQDPKNDEWFLKMFYAPKVPGQPYQFHFESCEANHPLRRCTLDKFDELTKHFQIENWQEWMRECNNDLSAVDLYTE